MEKENSKNSTESKRSFKENFKRHWKIALILLVLLLLLVGAGLWLFIGNKKPEEVAAGVTYTVQVKNSGGQSVEEVYVMLCKEDGTEINWLPYVTNMAGKVEFADIEEEGVYVKVVGVPVGYALDESVQYTFDEKGNVTIVLGDDDSVYVAQIGETMFTNFSSALGVANGKSGESGEIVIDLLADVTIKTAGVNNLYKGDIVINGNGHTITTAEDNHAFNVKSPDGSFTLKNMTIIHKNYGSVVQMNSNITVNMEDVVIDATQGSGYNYALINTLATDGTATVNLTRTNITMAAGTVGKDNYGGIIRTGNASGTKNVNINIDSCNLDTTGATGRHCIIVMKTTVATINVKNSTMKAADGYAVWAVEQTKAQTMTTVNSTYSSTKYPNTPIYGYAMAIGNTYYLPLQGALDIANASKSDITLRLIGDYTMKTATINNKNGATVTIDGNGKTLTTSGGSNAFVVGGKVAFENMNVNHKNTGGFIQMKEIANVTVTDVTLNATEGKAYDYCLVNMLAAGETSTFDATRFNVTMAVESAGKDANAAVIRTGNASDADKKTVEINLTDCNFDTTKATGRSAIVVMSTTTATVNLKNCNFVTMDDFVIRSNKQDINWDVADTTLTSLKDTYKDYPVEYYLARIGDVFYTFEEATKVASAATADTRIEILANYTFGTVDVNNVNDKLITIDGNGKTFTTSGKSNAFIIGNNATFENMKITHKNVGSVFQITEAGTVNVNDVTINATSGSEYRYALINIMATDDVTTLNLNGVDATMSVAGAGNDGKEGQKSAIIRTGNEGGSDAKTVKINLTDCNLDTTKATGRSGIVVMKNTTADIKVVDSTIATLDEAPIRARENSTLAYTLTVTNSTLDSKTKEFNKSNEPIRGYDAKIGDVYYHDLSHALSVANESTQDVTLTLAQDITVKENIDIANATGAAVTIDGNGHTITAAGGNNTFRIQKPENGTVGKVELKNMELVHKNKGAAVQINNVATVDLTDMVIDATNPDSTYNYALINIVAADKNATTYLNLTNVDLDMDDATSKTDNQQAIIRTGNAGGSNSKNVVINIVDSKLDASDAADRSVVRVMDTTNATIGVKNSTLKTNNISAIYCHNTVNGQATVVDNDFVCGKKLDNLTGYTINIGDTWFVGNSMYAALNNATEDMTITLTEDMTLDLEQIKNVNGKTITIVANGYNLNVTGSSDSVVIVNDTEVTVNGQTLYLSVEEAIATANSATADVTIKLNLNCELNLTNINNVNGKTITIDPNGYTVTGKGTLWDTVTVLGSAATCKVGNTTYFTADFAEALAKANAATDDATITLYADATVGGNVDIVNANGADVTINGNGHTVTATGGNNTFRVQSGQTGKVEFKNMTLVQKNYGAAVQINTITDVTLTDVVINATTPDSPYRYALINIVAAGTSATTRLNLTNVQVDMDSVAYNAGDQAIIRTGNGAAGDAKKVEINITGSNLDATGATNRNGIVIMKTTEATVNITDTTVKTLDAAPIKDNSGDASIRKTDYLIDVTSEAWGNAVAYIGNTPYESLSAALAAATANVRIELLANATVQAETIEKNVVIDGNNYTIETTGGNHAFTVKANVGFSNMTIKHTNYGSAVRIQKESVVVNLSDVYLDARYADQNTKNTYNYTLLSVDYSSTLNLTRVDVDMEVEQQGAGGGDEEGIIRTGNNESNKTKVVTITLDDCNLDASKATKRSGIVILDAEATITLRNNTTIKTQTAKDYAAIQGCADTNYADATLKANITIDDTCQLQSGDVVYTPGTSTEPGVTIQGLSSDSTVNVISTNAAAATMSLEDDSKDTVQLILDVPKSLYEAFVKWIKQFADDNGWDLDL